MQKNLFLFILVVLVIVVVCLFVCKKPSFKVGQVIDGFKIVDREIIYNNSRKDTVLTFRHEKTQALVTYLLNDDIHRFFSISFNAPTYNKTGVAHIIEHSVLSSSKKYKDNDLFFNLMKKTPATFLNAATAEGQIYYYFQTINNKDFMNLMDIYLDASLSPELSERTFNKEAWRLSLDKNDNLIYNGVVYNEMKDAYSRPDYYTYFSGLKPLFPELEFESGGDPRYITDLTYKDFLDFYKNTHNPSNSFTFVYGKADLKKELRYLDSVFNQFEKKEPIKLDYSGKELQQKQKNITSYPADKDEKSSYMVFSYIVGDIKDVVLSKKVEALKFLLTGYDDALFKKVFLENKLATDVDVELAHAKDKIAVFIVFEGVKRDNEAKVEMALKEVLNKLAKNGFGEDAEMAAKSLQEFSIKSENRFEFRDSIFEIYATYLFGGDYKQYLRKQAFYDDFINSVSDKNVWRNFVREAFIDNEKQVESIVRPDAKLFDNYEKDLKKKLTDIRKKMSDKQFAKLKKDNEKFIKEDAIVKEADFPILSIKDWNDDGLLIKTDEVSFDGGKILYQNIPSNGLVQMIFAFDMNLIEQDKLPAVGVYKMLSDKMGLKDKSNEEFILEQYQKLGKEIDSEVFVSPNSRDDDIALRYMVAVQSFDRSVSDAFGLLNDYLFKLDYKDEKKIKDIISREVQKYEIEYRQNGLPIFTEYSNESILRNWVDGYNYYLYLKDLLNNWNVGYKKLLKDFEYLRAHLFVRNNLLVDYVGPEKYLGDLKGFVGKLQEGEVKLPVYKFDVKKIDEARIIPSRNYKNYLRCKLNVKESWVFKFLPSFVTYNYLYPEIRIKGGAYGSKININPNGEVLFYSYADPNVSNTFEVYKKTDEFLKGFTMKKTDFEGVKIKSLISYLYPKTAFEKGAESLKNYLIKRSNYDIRQEYKTIKKLDVNDIRNLDIVFRNCATDSTIATVGAKEGINSNKDLYDEIK